MPRKSGESLNEYIARIETLADSQRLRVSEGFEDEQGNVLVKPTIIYAVDADGTPHETVGTTGFLKVTTPSVPAYQWPGGTTMDVEGTFVKTVADATGQIDITPATGDELILLYGQLAVGAVKAGAGILNITMRNATGGSLAQFNYIAAATASDTAHFPCLGTASTAQGNATSFGGAPIVISGTDMLRLTLGTMVFATSEEMTIRIRFRSLLGSAPTVTATGGTFT